MREIETGPVDQYGRGYHGLEVDECPHCGSRTERVTLKMRHMWAKTRKCPWCSRSAFSRGIIHLKRLLFSSEQGES